MEIKNLENAQVSILLEIDGNVHLVGMHAERLEAIETLIKTATEQVIATDKKQSALLEFLGVSKDSPVLDRLFAKRKEN